MRGPYGTRCQGRSIAASLPKATPLPCSFLLAPSKALPVFVFLAKAVIDKPSCERLGRGGAYCFLESGTFRHKFYPANGRPQYQAPKADKPSDDVPSPISPFPTTSNTEFTPSHRECLLPSCPNLNYAVWPPYLILLPAYRKTTCQPCVTCL